MTTHDTTSTQRGSYLTRTLGVAGFATLLIFGAAGCKSSSNQAANTAAINDGTATTTPDNGGDPAAANLAPGTQVMGQSSSYTPQQQSESYQGQQSAAPVEQGYNDQDQGAYNAGEDAIDQTDQPPPPLPDYDQPPAPDPNYLWTPGYWGWSNGGYYWVPGVWCAPPYYGALWTPSYWGYYGGHYGFHRGYWGPHIGYYGGVDYGFGYIGIGFFGGYWHGNNFYYNRSVTNVGHITNVYNHEVIYNNVHYGGQPVDRVSYNGGRGGLNVQPRPSELAAMHETHAAPLAEQRQVAQAAAQNKQQFYSANHGKPAEAVSARPIANVHGIAAPPAAVRQEEQHATQQRAADVQHNAAPAGQPQRGAAPEAQHGAAPGQPQRGAAPAQQERGATPAQQQRGNAPAAQQRNTAPAERSAPATQQRPTEQRNAAPAAQQHNAAPVQRNAAPVQRSAPAQQQRPAESRPAPVERSQPAARPQQQAAPRAQPAPRAQAAPHQQAAPRPAQHPAPARNDDKH